MTQFPEYFNELDKLVKASIMRHPIIFPSRIEVLEHLFMTNGNGYYWNFETGNSESAFGRNIYQFPNKIGSQQIEKSETSDHLGTQFIAMKHQFIEDNIDEIASDKMSYHTCELNIHHMSKHFSKNYSLIGQLLQAENLFSIKKIWRDGILELAEWFIQQTRVFYSLHSLDDMTKEADYIENERIKTIFLLFKTLNDSLFSDSEESEAAKKQKSRSEIAKTIAKKIAKETQS